MEDAADADAAAACHSSLPRQMQRRDREEAVNFTPVKTPPREAGRCLWRF